MALLGQDAPTASRATEDDIPTASPEGMTLFHVRPYKATPGFAAAPEFIRGLTAERDARVSIEPWFDEARIKFLVGAPDRGTVTDVVDSHFPNSVIEEATRPLPRIEPGEAVAGARLGLEMDCAYPLRYGFDTDPYKTVLPKLTGTDAERAFFQVTAEPVGSDWYQRGVMGADADKIGESRGEGRVVGQLNPVVVTTNADRDIKADIQNQRPRPAYRTVIRVFAIAPRSVTAERRVTALTGVLQSEYDHLSGQSLTPTYRRGDRLWSELEAATRRTIPRRSSVYRWLRGPSNVLTDREIAGLAHLPNADINAPDVDWSRMASGPGVPPDSPQHEIQFDDDGFIEEVDG